MQNRRGKTVHSVTVWYDARGKALAYLWKEAEEDGTPIPNFPDRLYHAPIVGRVCAGSHELVLAATRAAILANGFEIKGEVPPRFLNGWRPYRPGLSGGESLSVWVTPVDASKTKVVVRTNLAPSGLENQRLWNNDILERIGVEMGAGADACAS